MSEHRKSIVVDPTGPRYLVWRGALLAELALARVPELVVSKLASNGHFDLGHDFLVAGPHGVCFFVKVQAFSSMASKLREVAEISELRCPVAATTIRAARDSRTPVILFLFDADTDHGRFLRLDTLPDPDANSSNVMVRLPATQSITRESLEELIGELGAAPKV
jgi:hypothetical protein